MAKPPFLIFALLLLLSPNPATATDRCTGTVMLARFHDAYLSLIQNTGPLQRTAATTLLVIIGGKNAKAMARQFQRSGQTLDQDRLWSTMQDATDIATRVLADTPLPHDTFNHSQNIEWLSDAFVSTGCREELIVAATQAAQRKADEEEQTRQNEVPKTKTEKLLFPLVLLLTTVVLAGAVVVGVVQYRKSYTYRKHVVERMPRRPIKFDMKLVFTTPQGDMEETTISAMDISAGGMKVHWPDNNAPSGTNVTLGTPVGARLASVMWSNAHYAGIMFDKMLNSDDLKTIEDAMSEDASKTRNGAEGRRSQLNLKDA